MTNREAWVLGEYCITGSKGMSTPDNDDPQIKAVMEASGHALDDACRFLEHLNQMGWTVRPMQATFAPRPQSNLAPGLIIFGSHQATFTYRNWRGETGRRTVGVMSVWYGSTEWHPEPQWLLHAIDLDKMETRDFAMKDMTDVSFT